MNSIMLEQYEELLEALNEYFRELDTPIRDLTMIEMRRNQLRAAYNRAKDQV
jgi:hypothetical protein